MAVIVTIEMELDGFGNGWTDVSADVRPEEGVQGSRGLPGTTPNDHVAQTGVLSFAMDNSDQNSGAALGYYTPGHANARAGFGKHTGVRVLFTIGAVTLVMWTGTIDRVRPVPGVAGPRLTQVTAVDYMAQLGRKRLNALPMLVDADDHDVFAAIIDEVPVQPRALTVGTGFDTIAYAFDTMKDERAVPVSELQRLTQSTLARVFVRGDGTLVYEPRNVRATNISENVVTLTPGDFDKRQPPEIDDDADTEINRYQVILHPRVESEEEVILYQLEGRTFVEPNIPVLIRGLYTEPGQRARRAGGLDMLEAEAGTDYVLNSAPDGSGSDLTAQAFVDTIFTANSVLFTIQVPVAAWLTKLQARGISVLDQANTVAEAEDEDSIALNGENASSLDMPYQGSVAFGNEVAQYLLFLSRQSIRPVRQVSMPLHLLSDARALAFATREISDRFGVEESLTALPVTPRAGFFINAISFTVDHTDAVWLTWTAEISDATQYWRLEVPGQSELGFTTRLGFGLVVGHTDVAHADAHADSEHADSAHVDTHDDVGHQDAAHADSAHSDTHSDVAHTDTAHRDAHSDTAHSDVSHQDSHSDVAHQDTHSDVSHVDVPHFDSHGDEIDPHFDTHDDEAHQDGAHTDVHGDGAHLDTHNDVGHSDSHTDTHSDVSHDDVTHQDVHTDAGHGDAGHADVTHVDDHDDVAHDDAGHGDSHGDSVHGDMN